MVVEAARDSARDSVRRMALDATRRLLLHEGPSVLSMRRIAREVGSSTTVLYTLFGNKQQLMDALWLDGMQRLADAQQAAAEGSRDPSYRLRKLGEAYRTFALENPDTYRLLFAGAVPGYAPSPEALQLGRASLTPLIDAVRETLQRDTPPPSDPIAADVEATMLEQEAALVAATLWSTVHGVVSLELAGHFNAREGRAVASRAMSAIAIGLSSLRYEPQGDAARTAAPDGDAAAPQPTSE